MAREETARENLLAEATALVERFEIASEAESLPIVAGFRRDGSLSLYFGDDPVYHFNKDGELRRAFCDSLLYKANGGLLASLMRIRHSKEVVLQRHNLSADEQAVFLSTMASRLRRLDQLLDDGSYQVVGVVPEKADVIARVRDWLRNRGDWIVARTARL